MPGIERVTEDLLRVFRERVLTDLRVTITTTTLHSESLECHRALVDPARIDPLVDRALGPLLVPLETASYLSVGVNTQHARLADLKAAIEGAYTDADRLEAALAQLLVTTDFADCSLAVEDASGLTVVSRPAHKFVLAARCPYFATLFGSGFGDAALQTFNLPLDVFASPALFENVLSFIYLGRLRTPPKGALQLFDLYRCANFLAMDALEEFIVADLRALLHGLTCHCTQCSATLPSVLLFSDRMGLADLRRDAITVFAEAPLQLWTSLDFANFPKPVRDAVFAQFTLLAERDGHHLLHALVTLDNLLDMLQRRVSSAAYAPLVDAMSKLRDSLVPQLLPNLPFILGTLDRPPAMDIPARVQALQNHLVPMFNSRNIVFLAFTLHTLHDMRQSKLTEAQENKDADADLNAEAVVAALRELQDAACDWYARRWMNIPLAAPRGVYPGSDAWRGFTEYMADRAGVSLDEMQAAAGGMGNGSAVGRPVSVIGAGVVGTRPRASAQPRVRSMVIEGDTADVPLSRAGNRPRTTGATAANRRASVLPTSESADAAGPSRRGSMPVGLALAAEGDMGLGSIRRPSLSRAGGIVVAMNRLSTVGGSRNSVVEPASSAPTEDRRPSVASNSGSTGSSTKSGASSTRSAPTVVGSRTSSTTSGAPAVVRERPRSMVASTSRAPVVRPTRGSSLRQEHNAAAAAGVLAAPEPMAASLRSSANVRPPSSSLTAPTKSSASRQRSSTAPSSNSSSGASTPSPSSSRPTTPTRLRSRSRGPSPVETSPPTTTGRRKSLTGGSTTSSSSTSTSSLAIRRSASPGPAMAAEGGDYDAPPPVPPIPTVAAAVAPERRHVFSRVVLQQQAAGGSSSGTPSRIPQPRATTLR
ncbi:hypothetical protein H9P43_001623 [Blastocladiella emersonii ATCC 22665]|nr:hypothetical protein H9P43_001623 [Blastocladiella emersonii ATCC 22665]